MNKRSHLHHVNSELARAHAPVIHFDAVEPFLPLVAGYTVFNANGPSPSFPRMIELPDSVALAIEYAIWWDWDIAHLYELEHVWVYLDQTGTLVAADASWHGGWNTMTVVYGTLKLYAEPGKHAFASSIDPLLERRDITLEACTSLHKARRLLVTPLFQGVLSPATSDEQQLVRNYLERQLFQPTYQFSKRFALADARLVPWPLLYRWIPRRVRWWLDTLQTSPYSQERSS